MDERQETKNTYELNAKSMAFKYRKLSNVRNKDIEKTLSHLNSEIKNPFVLEIGCGNGREAKEILKYTSKYVGIDYSKQMISLAKKNTPKAKFKVADATKFEFPENTDVIFAFASLLHSNPQDLKKIFSKSHASLNENGLFFISLKRGRGKKKQTDEFGIRTFYYYNLTSLNEIMRGKFKIVEKELYDFNGSKWIDLLLEKI